MRCEAPKRLVSLLERLRLATASRIDEVAPRVRRLAGELPDFESVWVDALMQARVLTPFQAAEINARGGEALVCGPYVLVGRLAAPHYAECFAATHLETGRGVRLYRVARSQVDAASAVRQLQRMIDQLVPVATPGAGLAHEVGMHGEAIWAACSCADSVTAAQWMSEYGRFSPQVVLHIAREMIARLTELETLQVTHGDVGCAGLLLDRSGHVSLPMPGLRGIVRPYEGYGCDELPVEAYDYLAPERVADGSAPTIASDLYACGCAWRHLLTGRPPFAGGNALSKLKAVHAARLADVRQTAADVPPPLVRAIEWCTARDPAERPGSMSEVRQLLGAPSRSGPALLARSLQGEAWTWQPVGRRRAARRLVKGRPLAVAAGALALCLLAAGVWSISGKQGVESPKLAAADRNPSRPKVAVAGDTLPAATKPPSSVDAAIRDPNLVPTAAVEPSVATSPAVSELTGATSASELKLKAGQVVRSKLGRRAVVSVSGPGLAVEVEDVSFEGVDFVWNGPASGRNEGRDAMVSVAAGRIKFVGCSFSTPLDIDPSFAAPIAVDWHGPSGAEPAASEIVFRDCVFRGAQVVVDCRRAASLDVELTNTLCVAAGPVLRLSSPLPASDSLALTLDHVTTRGDCSLLECHYRNFDREIGMMVVTVNDSALVTNPQGALLRFVGAQRPTPLTRSLTWNGQGSLVTDETAIAVWRNLAGREQALAEDELEIGGLVRSEVAFAGAAHEAPPASRITRWNAPLQSDSAPGCDAGTLRLPQGAVGSE